MSAATSPAALPNDRGHDLVPFRATGFVGRLAADDLAKAAPADRLRSAGFTLRAELLPSGSG